MITVLTKRNDGFQENDDEGEEGEILVILDTAGIAAFCGI